VLGVCSLMIWALILIVTVKYVVFLMRADNKGEGGTLASWRWRSGSCRCAPAGVPAGRGGAALFYGDGIITPAVSVVSAVEGLRDAPGVPHQLTSTSTVQIISGVILVGLFPGAGARHRQCGEVLRAGDGRVVVVLAGLGRLPHQRGTSRVFRALSALRRGLPGWIGTASWAFVILGCGLLAVTGAEALYADMGHFGKRADPGWPGWLSACLTLLLNHLGPGALWCGTIRRRGPIRSSR
jgi:KUP system potassium uptake protein